MHLLGQFISCFFSLDIGCKGTQKDEIKMSRVCEINLMFYGTRNGNIMIAFFRPGLMLLFGTQTNDIVLIVVAFPKPQPNKGKTHIVFYSPSVRIYSYPEGNREQ